MYPVTQRELAESRLEELDVLVSHLVDNWFHMDTSMKKEVVAELQRQTERIGHLIPEGVSVTND